MILLALLAVWGVLAIVALSIDMAWLALIAACLFAVTGIYACLRAPRE